MALPPLDPELKKKLLVGIVLFLGVGYLFYDHVYSPRQAEVNAMESRLANIRLQNSTARGLTTGSAAGGVEQRLQLYRDQLAAVEGLIPSAEELPDLLDAISMQAQRTGVEISLIQPVGATEEQFYTRRTYDMAVLGSYHDIGEFLTRVGSLQRIVTPINLVLAPQNANAEALPGTAPKLEARFSIETYVIPTGQPTDAASTE